MHNVSWTYYVVVEGFSSSEGEFQLDISCEGEELLFIFSCTHFFSISFSIQYHSCREGRQNNATKKVFAFLKQKMAGLRGFVKMVFLVKLV